MKTGIRTALCVLTLVVSSSIALAAPALQVLGRDYVFPNQLAGLPARLSDFPGLQISTVPLTHQASIFSAQGDIHARRTCQLVRR